MNKKKIIILLAAVVLLAAVIYALTSRGVFRDADTDDSTNRSLFNDSSRASFGDVKKFRAGVSFDDPHAREYFSQSAATPHTVGYFKSIQMHFQEEKTTEEHLNAVYKYLLFIHPRDQAEALFALYKKFFQYEIDLSSEFKDSKTPTDGAEALDALAELQNYRMAYFGKEIADTLFGAEVKNLEYGIRKTGIIQNDDLYGNEKEEKLQELSREYWAGDASEAETYSLDSSARCDEMLRIYSKDLQEMDTEQRRIKTRQIREGFFTANIVDNLERLDMKLDQEKKNETEYREKEKGIRENPALSSQEKERKLEQLQEDMFGEEAELFRKKEAVRKSLQEQPR